MCHSIGGVGNKKGPLDGVGSKYSSADLHAWIIDAKGMTEKAKADRKTADEELRAAEGRRGCARRLHGVAEEVDAGASNASSARRAAVRLCHRRAHATSRSTRCTEAAE
jgi:hypothetical protein